MIRFLRILGPAISIVFCLGAFWFLDRQLQHYRYRDIRASLEAIPAGSVWLAMALTAVNYLVMVGYDRLALGYLGHALPLRKIALASFVGYAVAHNFGSLFGGTAIRYRLYSTFGLSAVEAVKAIIVCAATFWVGFFTLTGLAFLFEPPALPATLHLPFDTARPVGLWCLALVAGYLLASALRRAPVKWGQWEFSLPPLKYSLCQIAIASVDLAIAASVVYVLLPNSVPISFPAFLGVYLVTQVAALVTHVPGGLGIFEALMLLLLAPAEPQAVIGSLLIFRGIYYLLPLGLAAVLLGLHEAFEGRVSLRRFADAVGRWGPDLAPGVFACAVFVAGAILLVSGALPPAPARLAWLRTLLPMPVLEASHFLGSLAGAGLLLLAQGLYRRLDAAYVLTAVLLAGGSALSLLKGLDYGEALILAVLLAALLPCHRSFNRHAALIGDRFTSGWNVAAAMVLVSTIWLGFFSYKHVEYSNELWWQFTVRDNAPRFLRAMVGAFGVMLFGAAARLFRPAAPGPGQPGAAELAAALAVIRQSPTTHGSLAMLGDKRLLFNQRQTAFIMYAIEGRSWVALGDPVGPAAELPELAWRFRELCDRHEGWPAFYQVDQENLSIYLDLGLSLVKLGEEARVELATFSRDDPVREALRQAVARCETEGLSFEVLPAADVPRVVAELKPMSDAWLAASGVRERGFSLAYFTAEYVANFPAAVVRRGSSVVALANVVASAGREDLSVDLVRYALEAPDGVMDFLLVRLIEWARAEGYRTFNLGMAPLEGMEDHWLAPLRKRMGAMVFRHGEHFDTFRSLREYKARFGPEWRPKYLAAPGGWVLPRILADIAALVTRESN